MLKPGAGTVTLYLDSNSSNSSNSSNTMIITWLSFSGVETCRNHARLTLCPRCFPPPQPLCFSAHHSPPEAFGGDETSWFSPSSNHICNIKLIKPVSLFRFLFRFESISLIFFQKTSNLHVTLVQHGNWNSHRTDGLMSHLDSSVRTPVARVTSGLSPCHQSPESKSAWSLSQPPL